MSLFSLWTSLCIYEFYFSYPTKITYLNILNVTIKRAHTAHKKNISKHLVTELLNNQTQLIATVEQTK